MIYNDFQCKQNGIDLENTAKVKLGSPKYSK